MPESRKPIDEVMSMLDAFGLRRAPPPSTDLVDRPDYSGAKSDAELIILWLDRYESAHTQRAYRGDLELFRAFLETLPAQASQETPERPKTLREVKVSHLVAFAKYLRARGSVRSHARRLAAVKSLLSFGHKTGYLLFNVGAAVDAPRIPNELAERILTQEEVYALIRAAAPGRDRTLLRFLYLSGARISEALALRWTHVHMERDRLMVTLHGKGGKTRHIPLPVSLNKDFEILQQTRLSNIVFESVRGRPLHQPDGWNIVRAAALAANIDHKPSPHWLRHAHASHALRNHCPPHIVQFTLGHASLTTTSTYVHVESNESSSMFLAA
jgi:integrase/recombinase XerD